VYERVSICIHTHAFSCPHTLLCTNSFVYQDVAWLGHLINVLVYVALIRVFSQKDVCTIEIVRWLRVHLYVYCVWGTFCSFMGDVAYEDPTQTWVPFVFLIAGWYDCVYVCVRVRVCVINSPHHTSLHYTPLL
jgi:hypothetical protein